METHASQNDLYEEYRLSHRSLHKTFEAEQKEFDDLIEDIENKSYFEMEARIDLFNLEEEMKVEQMLEYTRYKEDIEPKLM